MVAISALARSPWRLESFHAEKQISRDSGRRRLDGHGRDNWNRFAVPTPLNDIHRNSTTTKVNE